MPEASSCSPQSLFADLVPLQERGTNNGLFALYENALSPFHISLKPAILGHTALASMTPVWLGNYWLRAGIIGEGSSVSYRELGLKAFVNS